MIRRVRERSISAGGPALQRRAHSGPDSRCGTRQLKGCRVAAREVCAIDHARAACSRRLQCELLYHLMADQADALVGQIAITDVAPVHR